MRTNADQRRRIFQLFDINCTKISVQDINDPRQQQLHVRGMRRFDFDLRFSRRSIFLLVFGAYLRFDLGAFAL